MKLSRANFAAVKLGKGILVSGGNNQEQGVTNSCEYYINDAWTEYPAMKVKRQAHSMCLYKGCVYVFGGMDESNKQLTSIERLNPSDSQQGWQLVCDMPKPLCNMGLLAYDSQILIFGGVSINETLDEIHQFDPSATTFSVVGKLAKPDSFPHAESSSIQSGATLVIGRAYVHDLTPQKVPSVMMLL